MRVGSLFSGVGGFDLGLECAGFDVSWQVESDKWCRQVLRARWPDVDLYGDVKDVGSDLDGVDLICGGFPCQDLSVAGKREGLAGERSGLFFEFIRIADSVAPRWVLVENVPGLLSSNDGQDFAVVLAELTGFHPDVPEGGWNSGGFCQGPKRRCFWRVLDTQYFGPPQRRRRVFVVCDSRAECGPEVLFESSCVPGHPAARREAGEGSAGEPAPGTFPALRGFGHGWQGQHNDDVARAVAGAVKAQGGPDENDAKDGRIVGTYAFHSNRGHDGVQENLSPTVRVGSGIGIPSPPAFCFADPRRHDEGHRGTIRGKPCINATNNDPVYPTRRENWRNNSNPATEARMLAWQGGKHTTGYQGDRAVHPEGRACTLPGSGANNGGGGGQILGQAIPRRLTPRECERLQGFPDDWTRWGYLPEVDDMTFEEIVAATRAGSTEKIPDGFRVEISDTQRYKQMGNAVSVPVAAWIGSRIVAAEMGAI